MAQSIGRLPIQVVIQFESGPESGRSIVLERGQTITFGRGSKAGVALSYDNLLSGLHFEIAFTDRGVQIRDLGSRNGTKLNGAEVKEAAPLRNSDYIMAGQTGFSIRFVSTAPPPAAAPSAPRTASPPMPPAAPYVPPAPAALRPVSEEKWRDTGESAIPKLVETPVAPVALLDFLRGQKEPLYAVLDAARDPQIIEHLWQRGYVTPIPNAEVQPEPQVAEGKQKIECMSLFDGYSALEYERFAPYLVRLPADHEFLGFLAGEAWGKSWGIYLTCRQPLADVRQHLRQFLTVEMPKGYPHKTAYFRFYDPRVLRVFLPVCSQEEAKAFFGPAAAFMTEQEEPGALAQFTPGKDSVQQQAVPLLPVSEQQVAVS